MGYEEAQRHLLPFSIQRHEQARGLPLRPDGLIHNRSPALTQVQAGQWRARADLHPARQRGQVHPVDAHGRITVRSLHRHHSLDVGQSRFGGTGNVAGDVFTAWANHHVLDVKKAQHITSNGPVGLPAFRWQLVSGLQGQYGVDDRSLGEILKFELRVAAGVALQQLPAVNGLVELPEHKAGMMRPGDAESVAPRQRDVEQDELAWLGGDGGVRRGERHIGLGQRNGKMLKQEQSRQQTTGSRQQNPLPAPGNASPQRLNSHSGQHRQRQHQQHAIAAGVAVAFEERERL